MTENSVENMLNDRIAHLEFCLQAARIESTWKSEILKRIRDKLINIKYGVTIEHDHALFQRASDAADFVDVVDELDELDWERIAMKGEPVRDYIAELSLANRRLRDAEHMNRVLMKSDDVHAEAVRKLSHRNSDLLEANNRYLEIARSARAMLRKIGGLFKLHGGEFAHLAPEIDAELDKRINP